MSVTVSTGKECKRCGVVKPLGEFPRQRNARDGYGRLCKPCNVCAVQEWRRRTPELQRARLKPKREVVCEGCGVVFWTTRRGARACGAACSRVVFNASRRKQRPDAICVECGAAFVAGGADVMVCSVGCGRR